MLILFVCTIALVLTVNIQLSFQFELNSNLTCPYGWYHFNSSCYKTEKFSSYRRAKDTCSKFKHKLHKIRTPHLVNIESDDEMNYVLSIMNNETHRRFYVGANNILNKDSRLLWETIGTSTQVDSKLLCKSAVVNENGFSCGVLQISSLLMNTTNFTYAIANEEQNQLFCIDITDCFAPIPFLCEVNCTNQESQCASWVEDINSNFSMVENACNTNLHRCKHNSTCVGLSGSSYVCLCQPGFNGTFCEQDERPCLPNRNRCRNNSTCSQHGWKYNCTCASGFTGSHCEINIDDCVNSTCMNGGQCIDLINAYECNCISFFYGNFCEHKNTELVIKEQVSRSFSVLAITVIILTYGFFISLDTLRYVFHIEPDSLSQERHLIRKKRLVRKIIKDLKDKKKRRRYFRVFAAEIAENVPLNKTFDDEFIRMLEETFNLSYDRDLVYIDENVPFATGSQSSLSSKTQLSDILVTICNNEKYQNNVIL